MTKRIVYTDPATGNLVVVQLMTEAQALTVVLAEAPRQSATVGDPNWIAPDTRAPGVYDQMRPAHLIYPGRTAPETDDEFFARMMANGRDVPAGVSARIVQLADLPADRSYRNAWRDTGTVIDHDMTKARAIHMNLIRRARDAALVVQDNLVREAEDTNNGQARAAAAAERQRLRNIPQTFDLSGATTIDQLKQLWPANLARPE